MRKILESEFKKQRKWFDDGDKLEDGHLLQPFVQTNCWPPCSVIQSFVVTEYLIKRDFLDLFPGITMKDSLK